MLTTTPSHRARIQAAKHLANKSAAAISEILGIAPTPSPISSMTHSGSLTPITPADSDLTLEKLTTSNKSVGDYFKEKLAAKSGTNTPATNVDVDASRRGTDTNTLSHNDDQLRVGLGAGRKSQVEEDADCPPAGIGGLSNAFAQFFAASSSSHATVIRMASSATHAIVQSPTTMATSYKAGEEETTDKQRRKAKKKEERREECAEEVGAKAERKKLKEAKRKMRTTDFTEEPEGGSQSNSKRRKEDKKKKKGSATSKNLQAECKDEKRSMKSKKQTEIVKEDE